MRRAPFAVPFLLACAAVAQDPAADRLAALPLEAKAGQLFMAWTLSRSEGDGAANNHEKLLAAVREAGLGGVIVSLGSTADAAQLIPRLQAEAKVPLLIAGDFEGGVWFRLRGATELGNQMLVGATGSPVLAEAMGRATAQQAAALGCHWVFAPVLDVNSNPANPIINVRSFGEDPELVAKLGSAFVRGVQSEGLLACGKHFPGHGDVDSDSHLALPTVPGDAARLRRVELRPFAAAIEAGLASVMTGHLAVPGLGEEAHVPATLSRRILTGVLRGELGFDGLIVTDALEMGGVKNAFAPGEVAVQALLAGADVLLMPPDPLAARAAVVEAVQQGRVPMARLDEAVLRILRAKAKVGLLSGGGGPAADFVQRIDTEAHRQVADSIAGRGVTLVRDRGGLLPLRAVAGQAGPLVVTLLDRDEGAGRTFARTVGGEELRVAADSAEAAIAAVAKRVAAAEHLVLNLHVKVREYAGSVGLPPTLLPVVQALRDEQHVVAVSFGSPYLVQQMPAIDSYLCAYTATERTELVAAHGLRGNGWLFGRLPVSIPGVAAAGTGLSLLPDGDVKQGEPVALGVDPALPQQVQALLQQAITDGAFPGAVCLVARHGFVLAEVAVGKVSAAADAAPVTTKTPFDLASLTKVCATTPAVLQLVAAGKLSLDDPVAKWVPAFAGVGKANVTVRHLLAHQAGLPAYERYYRTLAGKDAIVAAAAAEGLMYEPGTGPTYSDLGFVLLMAVVEAASGQPFAAFTQQQVFRPLHMRSARWVPTGGPALAGAAATELDERRGGVVQGFVHDENAFAMGGVSGHAGLFATGLCVLEFGCAMLAGGKRVLPRALVEQAVAPSGFGGDTTRGLGFQRLAGGSWAGTEVSPGTFGHTGFTGTSLWCDPRLDLCVVLLTNRVHPTRVNNRITAVRRALHDLVRGAVR
jgi:beta-N-acetylhexosaminidase